MKEIKHEVITQGTPRLENMPKEAFNVFCTSLLSLINDEMQDKNIKKSKILCKDYNKGDAKI